MGYRVGAGYDVHRLKEGRPLVLGCFEIPGFPGPLGFSDGDPLAHAVADALLGALGAGDIGDRFPPGDPHWAGCPSKRLLEEVIKEVERRGWSIANVDTTVFLESPRLGPYKDSIRRSLAEALRIDDGRVSIKARSTEGFGPVGCGNAVAAAATVLLEKRLTARGERKSK